MYQVRRVTQVPATALQVQIDGQPDGSGDGGFQGGGVYHFQPAAPDGEAVAEGSFHHVSEHAARILMTDPSLRPHFVCTPDLPADGGADTVNEPAADQVAAAAPAPATDEQPGSTSEPARGRRTRAGGK